MQRRSRPTLCRLEDRITPTIDILNLNYAGDTLVSHQLDLHLPDTYLASSGLPVIVWVHGGGWQSGTKEQWLPAQPFVNRGYVVASINYRLTGPDSEYPANEVGAVFPAQIHDVKGAVRWLRANATTYHFDVSRFVAWGSSAGGHLVSLLGTSGSVAELEGTIGGNLPQSSRVQAVVDYYGPTDLWAMVNTPGYESHGAAGSPESKLINAAVSSNKSLADIASPISYVTTDDPDFFFAHKTADAVVPYNQSQLLNSALTGVGIATHFVTVPNTVDGNGQPTGSNHGGAEYTTASMEDAVATFLSGTLPAAPLPLDGAVVLTKITGNGTLNAANVTGYDFTLTRADSTQVSGVLIAPQGLGPAPAVVVNHGAAGSIAGARNFGITNGAKFAAAGYIVIAPIYEHAVANIAFNTAETIRRATDAVAMLQHLAEINQSATNATFPTIDLSRVGMFGHSKGAYLTIALLQNSTAKPFIGVAGITAGGVRNGAGQSPPVADADLINVPMVIQHAEDDNTVPYAEGLALWNNMRPDVKAVSIFHTYSDQRRIDDTREEDTGHNIVSAKASDVFPLAIDFFNQRFGLDPISSMTSYDAFTIGSTVGASYTLNVLANDGLAAGWSLTSVTNGGHGIAQIAPGGQNVTYTFREYVGIDDYTGYDLQPFVGDEYFTYTISNGTLSETARVRVGVYSPHATPRVSTIKVDDASGQRSMVRTLVVTFDSEMTLPPNPATAFRLQRTGQGATGEATLAANLTQGPQGQTIATLTFSGSLTEFGSLIDGQYSLTVLAEQAHVAGLPLDGNGDALGGDDYTFTFHRLFGDGDGNAAVDFADFIMFRNAFGSSNSIFNFDNDGEVEQDDFIALRNRFGSSV